MTTNKGSRLTKHMERNCNGMEDMEMPESDDKRQESSNDNHEPGIEETS